MPELPEVETIRSQLAPHIEGAVLRKLEVVDPRWCRPLAPDALANRVAGLRVQSLTRRGKYLIWELDGDSFLLMHLRMTGTLLLDPSSEPPHCRVRLELARGAARHRVLFIDPRRFGTGELASGRPALDAFLDSRLGLEPLSPDFTASRLRRMARYRRAPIKAFLLDQRHIAGLGNIYADEALFRARIHPLRPAGRLSPGQYMLLRDAVVAALGAGVAARGATIDDFRHVDGVAGTFQDQFLVHRRAGLPCPACGTTIKKIVLGGRGTYLCEACQPRPRPRSRRAISGSRGPPVLEALAVLEAQGLRAWTTAPGPQS